MKCDDVEHEDSFEDEEEERLQYRDSDDGERDGDDSEIESDGERNSEDNETEIGPDMPTTSKPSKKPRKVQFQDCSVDS